MPGGGDGEPLPANGGEFLLQLLKNPPQVLHHPQPQSPAQPPPRTTTQILTHDPVVAALGPSVPIPFPQQLFPPNGLLPPPHPWPHHHRHQSPPPYAPHSYFLQNPNPSSSQVFPTASPQGFSQGNFLQTGAQLNYNSSGDGVRKLGVLGTNSNTSSADQQDAKDLVFGSLGATGQGFLNAKFGENLLVSQEDERNLGISRINEKKRDAGLEDTGKVNEFAADFQQISVNQNSLANSSVLRGHGQERSDGSGRGTRYWGKQGHNFNSHRSVVPPPGFISQQMSGGSSEYTTWKENNDHYRESRYRSGKDATNWRFSSRDGDRGLSGQLDRPGPPAGSKLHSVPASDIEESTMAYHTEDGEIYKEFGNRMRDMKRDIRRSHNDLDDLEEQLVDSLGLEDESDEKGDQKKHHGTRDREYRSDKRGQWLMSQRRRQLNRQIACRGDIDVWNASFLDIYESLIPAEEEKAKQKQLLMLLEKIVCKEWPEARLFLYGSCANSFGFSKSDIDVCLTIDVADIKKSDVLLKLADMLQLENLQNVQALTRARVPIVKLMDPATGISCDICINNVLAVVNTKLLRDYAQIDLRLRQLAFLVKHWAKSRGVNETYQGTLSSYAYVLMCIHFLQHRRPAILPCLQEMDATYFVTVDNVEYSYFDEVEKLVGCGSRNRESIAQLVWGFFKYWAYCHDYANDVISVRTGSILSKRSKDWTRRIGNDRHLICIEDPFEVSHDLGRVVDKYSIRVLREEFERAAEIMQYDPNPCVKLFEPYINIPT